MLGAAHMLNACISCAVIVEISSFFVSSSIPGKLCQMLLTRTLCQKFARNVRSVFPLTQLVPPVGPEDTPGASKESLLGQVSPLGL